MQFHRHYVLLAGLVGVSLLIQALPSHYKYSLAQGASTGLFSGGQWLFSRIIRSAENKYKEKYLLRQNVALALKNMRLEEANKENERLRRILEMKTRSPSKEFILAEVIARDAERLYDVITIDAGTDRGILLGWPVVTVDGLVGHVSQVHPNNSNVHLILDSKVSGIVQESRIHTIVSWVPGAGNLFRLSYVEASSEIEVGDHVVSSGLGGRFPKAIPIGHVTRIHQGDRSELFKEIFMESFVDLWAIEEVFVIPHPSQ